MIIKDQGKRFMHETKYRFLDTSDQVKKLPQPPLYLGPDDPSHTILDLPDPRKITMPMRDITEIINNRVSVRKYADKPLTQEELSYLLWVTQGIKEVTKRPATLRTVPSAGSRHPFETYLLINRVEGIKPGLYRFLAFEHKLEEINLAEDMAELITAACHQQAMVKNCGVTFIWTAVRYRTYWRYGERGYRYFHLDAGHVCQNLYLAADVVDSGCCGIAAFDDDDLNALLGLDGEERFTVYVCTCGKKE